MAGRCVRRIRIVWNKSITPSHCIRSNTILNDTKTPVLPTPPLFGNKQKKKKTKRYESLYDRLS